MLQVKIKAWLTNLILLIYKYSKQQIKDKNMALLSLVKNSKGELFLRSTESSQNAEFSIFDVDGEGSGSPFDFGSETWVAVEGVTEQAYNAEDQDSFWEAQQKIVKECQENGIELPDYVETW